MERRDRRNGRRKSLSDCHPKMLSCSQLSVCRPRDVLDFLMKGMLWVVVDTFSLVPVSMFTLVANDAFP